MNEIYHMKEQIAEMKAVIATLNKSDEDKEEITSPENLRKFLENNDSALRRMGLSMAKGCEVPEEIFPMIISLSELDPEEENREAARKLVSSRSGDFPGLNRLKVFRLLNETPQQDWRGQPLPPTNHMQGGLRVEITMAMFKLTVGELTAEDIKEMLYAREKVLKMVAMSMLIGDISLLDEDMESILFNSTQRKDSMWDTFDQVSIKCISMLEHQDDAIKKRYKDFTNFTNKFCGTLDSQSLLIDWALDEQTCMNKAVKLLKEIKDTKNSQFYIDYLIDRLDANFCDEDMAEYIWESGTDDAAKIIEKYSKDAEEWGQDGYDYFRDCIGEAFEAYFDFCKILVEILKTLVTIPSDRVRMLLEERLKGDSPISGQMENAIVILSGGEGRDWNSFDLNFGVYL